MPYLKVCVLRSSSHGNCTAIWTAGSAILIDCAGILPDEMERELSGIGLDPSEINGIVITHGHEDHICKNTFKIASRYEIPVYIHRDTYRVVKDRCGVKDRKTRIEYHTEEPFLINGLKVTPFKTHHKGGYCGKPFGFCVEYKNALSSRKVGLLTDTSEVTDSMIKMLYDCKCLIIECNHDAAIAWKKSPRQSTWKEHLNNDAAAEALIKIKRGSADSVALRHVFLAHISERHNKAASLVSRISQDIRKEKITGCDLMLTYRKKRTEVANIL